MMPKMMRAALVALVASVASDRAFAKDVNFVKVVWLTECVGCIAQLTTETVGTVSGVSVSVTTASSTDGTCAPPYPCSKLRCSFTFSGSITITPGSGFTVWMEGPGFLDSWTGNGNFNKFPRVGCGTGPDYVEIRAVDANFNVTVLRKWKIECTACPQ